MTPDALNACFELAAAAFVTLHARRVWTDREVAGVSIPAGCFFASWTLFGFFYFAMIGHWISFACSFPPMVAYVAWIAGLVRFRRREPMDVPGCPPPGQRVERSLTTFTREQIEEAQKTPPAKPHDAPSHRKCLTCGRGESETRFPGIGGWCFECWFTPGPKEEERLSGTSPKEGGAMKKFTLEGFDIPSHNQTVRLCVMLLRLMQQMSGRDLSSERLAIMSLIHDEDGGFLVSDKVAGAVSLYQDFIESQGSVEGHSPKDSRPKPEEGALAKAARQCAGRYTGEEVVSLVKQHAKATKEALDERDKSQSAKGDDA